MKLLQAVLISLTLLICFSPTMSLAMEMVAIDVNNLRNNYQLLEDRNEDMQINLAHKLKNKNIQLFRSLYNHGIMEKFKSFIREIRFCLKSVYLKGVPFCILLIAVWFLIMGLCIYINNSNLDVIWSVLFILLVFNPFMILGCWCTDQQRYLEDALESNNVLELRYIIKHENFVNSNPDIFLKKAILQELPEDVIETLFDKGGRFLVEDFGEVIEKASYAMVKLLVDLGIDVNVKDESGTPAVAIAVRNNKLDVIDLLLSKNVDACLEDAQGKTILDYLNAQPEIANAQVIRDKLVTFRHRISDKIYDDLEKFNFPRVHADIISEYLV